MNHFTPNPASWLNAAEIEASLVPRECLGKQRVASLVETHLSRQRLLAHRCAEVPPDHTSW